MYSCGNVGHFEYSFIPCRTSSSSRILNEEKSLFERKSTWRLALIQMCGFTVDLPDWTWFKSSIVARENLHFGSDGIPFMNNTIPDLCVSLWSLWVSVSPDSDLCVGFGSSAPFGTARYLATAAVSWAGSAPLTLATSTPFTIRTQVGTAEIWNLLATSSTASASQRAKVAFLS